MCMGVFLCDTPPFEPCGVGDLVENLKRVLTFCVLNVLRLTKHE